MKLRVLYRMVIFCRSILLKTIQYAQFPACFPYVCFPIINYHSATLIRICYSQPPQLCFNKWNQNLPAHSSWPPLYLVRCLPYALFYMLSYTMINQNVQFQPPQQCFNMPGGLSDSRYAPLASPPVLHGYGDYQPLRYQPPPLKQERPSSEFEPHKVKMLVKLMIYCHSMDLQFLSLDCIISSCEKFIYLTSNCSHVLLWPMNPT